MTEEKPKKIEEKWSIDGLPNVEPPTEETLAYVAWIREQDKKKNNPKKMNQ